MCTVIERLLGLEAVELLRHEDVAAAYWKLMGNDRFCHVWIDDKGISTGATCFKCNITCPDRLCPIPDPIPGSLADVAFEMRSKLTDEQWQIGIRAVYCIVYEQDDVDEYGVNTDAIMWAGAHATAKQLVIAAVLGVRGQE